jgi:hypothetical protein
LIAPEVFDTVLCERVEFVSALEPGGAEMIGEELLLLSRVVLLLLLLEETPIAC